ncbi:cyclase family protein [Haloplanus sp. GCM10025708]|uniref:cyclase family protein n=1 Tax=Haloferacaceae TaxID=1644056 RepID=UPI00361489C6
MYDLSQRLADGMQTFPDDPEVRLSPTAVFEADGYRVTSIECGSHTGTHVDAPTHTEPDGDGLDAFPIDRFVLETVRVDCRDLGARDAIPPERVPETDVECVAFHTGWDDHWGTDRYLDHPYVAPETARRCAERGYDVGVDTLNPDPTPSPRSGSDEPTGFEAHHELLGNDCLVFENLTGLERVPERFELRAYPLALGGDGAPVRAVGVADE